MSWINSASVKTRDVKEIETAARIRALKKLIKRDICSTLTVTTKSGNVFDADEKSQSRMCNRIIASSSDNDTVIWIMHDNSLCEISITELRLALQLAVKELSRIVKSDPGIDKDGHDKK